MTNKIADNDYQKNLKCYYLQLKDKCEFFLKKKEKTIILKQKLVIENDNGILTGRCHMKTWICINLFSSFDDVLFIMMTWLLRCYKRAWAPRCMPEVACQIPPPPAKGLALVKGNRSTTFNQQG